MPIFLAVAAVLAVAALLFSARSKRRLARLTEKQQVVRLLTSLQTKAIPQGSQKSGYAELLATLDACEAGCARWGATSGSSLRPAATRCWNDARWDEDMNSWGHDVPAADDGTVLSLVELTEAIKAAIGELIDPER